jgi:uncharacterized membrane protein
LLRPSRARLTFESGILACALAAALFGAGARFWDLDGPLFWQDEAFTALRATGHLEAELTRTFDGGMHPVQEIRALESVDPARGVPAVVRAIATEDPHHSPLFYVMERAWIGVFGTTPAGFRSLSATLGVLGIGLAFALGATLFGSRIGGAVTASLLALSPIFVLYSRQAREYALFADATMLATLVFIRALRTPSPVAWAAYAATVAFGFYVDPIFALVAAAHALSAALEPGRRFGHLGAWLSAASAGALCYLPWALNALHARGNIAGQMDWGRTAYPFKYLALKWGFNLAALGFDGEFRTLSLAPVAALVIVAIGVALALLTRPEARPVARIVVPLGATTLAVLVARDRLFDSHFELTVRYLTPFWLGLILAGAAALVQGLGRPGRRTAAFALWAALLLTGATAAIVRGGAENWWDNNDQIAFQQMAREINRADRPLVLSQGHPHPPLVLARYLRDDTTFVLFRNAPPPLPAGRSAFVVAPTRDVLVALVARAHGLYALANVSPQSSTVIARFHTGLWRAAPAVDRGDYTVFVPQNALWALEPARPGQAKTGF